MASLGRGNVKKPQPKHGKRRLNASLDDSSTGSESSWFEAQTYVAFILLVGMFLFVGTKFLRSPHLLGGQTLITKIQSQPKIEPTTLLRAPPMLASQSQPSVPLSAVVAPTAKPKAKKKPQKRRNPNPDEIVVDNGVEVHIRKIPGEKTGIKQDMRVVLPDFEYVALSKHPPGPPSGIVSVPRAYSQTLRVLKSLPLFTFQSSSTTPPTLEQTMKYIQTLPQCSDKPVFLSMASVGDDLYWQLIENFVYTMVKFDTIGCSLVICVSDPNCMTLCRDSFFPCFDFRSAVLPRPSVMEQIGELKLAHIPKALAMGVDVFMLDLDVGFLNDPMVMVRAFYATPKIDIFVQEDLIFIMNRTKAGWKTWFTQPLPNIGLFLCRGNNKTAQMFSIAWSKYQKMEDILSKANPGKDQNHVLDAMRIGRGTFGLRYAYFSNDTAVLLDKMVLNHNRSVELGGQASGALFTAAHSIAAHTTCYEHTTKVLGLKATNAYWNPRYYDPLRPTITKQIIYLSDLQVLDEVRSLIWLGLVTGRSVIIPNILGNDKIEAGHEYGGRVLWPGFRVIKMKRSDGRNSVKINILEPAYYWRVERDYDAAPAPHVLIFDKKASLESIRDTILSLEESSPRVVLYPTSGRRAVNEKENQETIDRLTAWALDSVGFFEWPYSQETRRYSPLPSVKTLSRENEHVQTVLDGMRTCKDIMGRHKGNRTCFQICK